MAVAEPLREEADAEFRARWLWTGVIVGLLLLQVLMCLIAVFLSSADPAQTVVENYHDRALGYEASRVARQRALAAGWALSVSAAGPADILGQRFVELTLVDRHSAPVSGVTGMIEAFHHARGHERQLRPLEEQAGRPGVYRLTGVFVRTGLWEFALAGQLAGESYEVILRQPVEWAEVPRVAP